MRRKDPSKLLILAGLVIIMGLLVIGCAKKPEPVPEPVGPTAEELEQARLDSIAEVERLAAEAAAAEEAARLEAEEKARMEAEQAAKASLKVIYFDFDRSNLRPDAREAAEFNAGVLAQYSGWSVLIEGHCDERGTDEYNLALGERRAGTVKDFFINYGIDATRLNTVSYGEERPMDSGHNKEAWEKNRRAALVIR
jgi:peptidoglycan-associated lipoprotein